MEIERKKNEILLRLKKIEGQVRGIQRMVEKGVTCSEILTQIAAATSTIKKVSTVIVQTYMEECLEKSQKESGAKQKEVLRDFYKAISRYIDWA